MPSSPDQTNPFRSDIHPNDSTLSDFNSGRLDASQLAHVEAHLEECDVCCNALSQASSQSDRFVAELQSAASSQNHTNVSTYREEPHVQLTPASGDANENSTLPTRIGRFVVKREIGQGGFGIVFLCDDPQLKRDVAVKIPRFGGFITSELRDRFLREAQATAALDHPNIVPIHEAGEVDGICYIASAYCSGPSLSAWFKQRQQMIPVRTVARIVRDICSAVEHAHQRGVLHRDLKPSNVLLEIPNEQPEWPSMSSSMDPRLTDFGLAKIVGESPDSTRSNIVMGTANYMSPEQARGQAKAMTDASDIYSLGAILYELLTGRPPIVGDSDVETLQRIQHEEPVPPKRLRPKLPIDLETICLTCLQKEPHRRFGSAHALGKDLQAFLDGQPINARPIGRIERCVRWCSRKPALAILSACSAVLLIALVAGSVLSAFWIHQQQQRTLVQLDETVRARRDAVVAGQRALSEERSARSELFASLLAEARARRLSGRGGQKFESLRLLHQASTLANSLDLDVDHQIRLRNEAIACLSHHDLRVDKTWSAYPDGSTGTGIAYDMQFKKYASFDRLGRLVVRALEDNRELWAVDVNAPLSRRSRWWLPLKFSPDGNFLAARGVAIAGNPLHIKPTRVWDCREEGGPLLEIPNHVLSYASDFDFTPDSRQLVLSSRDGSIVRVDLDSSVSSTVIGPGAAARALKISPTGNQIAICRGSEVLIVNLAGTDDIVARLPTVATAVCWSSDGQSLATGKFQGEAEVWDVQNAKLIARCSGHKHEVFFVGFLPLSGTLATTSWDGTRFWNPANGQQLLRVDAGTVSHIGASNRWLGFGVRSQAGRYELAQPEGYQTLNRFPSGELEVSANSRLLLATDSDRLMIWDTSTFQLVTELPLPAQGAKLLACFDADASHLITATKLGLHRWPLRWGPGNESPESDVGTPRSSAGRQRLTVGPPEQIEVGPVTRASSLRCTLGGRLLLSDDYGIRLMKLDHNKANTERSVRQYAWNASASPDSRLLVSSQWQTAGTYLWDVATGRKIKKIESMNSPSMFSPDGRVLLVCNVGGYEFYEVGSWKVIHTIKTNVFTRFASYASKCDLLAVLRDQSTVSLLNANSLELIADFPVPTQEQISRIELSPNGRLLIVRTATKTVHVWDLWQVQAALDRLTLGGRDYDTGRSIRRFAPIPAEANKHIQNRVQPPIDVVVYRGVFDELERLTSQLVSNRQLGENPANRSHRAQLYGQRGDLHARLQQWSQALADFDQAITLTRPTDSAPKVDDQTDGIDETISDIDRAELFLHRGQVRFELGQYDLALENCNRSIQLKTKPPQRSAETAASRFDETNGPSMEDSSVAALRLRGQIHQRQQHYSKALIDFEAAGEQFPNTPELWMDRAAVLVALQNWPETIRAIEQGLTLQQDSWDRAFLVYLRGVAYFSLGKFEEAFADGEQALELDPENQVYNRMVAWAYATCPDLQFRDPDRAVKLAEYSIGIMRRNPEAWNTLGMAYYSQGSIAKAKSAVNESIQIQSGGNAFDWYILAMIASHESNAGESRDWFAKADRWRKDKGPGDLRLQLLHQAAMDTQP